MNPSLILVQPRMTRTYQTEILLIGPRESNQTNCNSYKVEYSSDYGNFNDF